MSKKQAHKDFCAQANSDEKQVIRRHLENMQQTYGTKFTQDTLLKILKDEINRAKRAQKAG